MSNLLQQHRKNERPKKIISQNLKPKSPKPAEPVKPSRPLPEKKVKKTFTNYKIVIKALMRPYAGILAIDEMPRTLSKRFSRFKINDTEFNKKYWRELMLTTENLSDYISGVILHEETAKQMFNDKTFVSYLRKAGIVPGIKVDIGTIPTQRNILEKTTGGLKDLREKLIGYRKKGLLFTKWRSEFMVGNNLPSKGLIEENTDTLVKYTSIALSEGMVPILEPEILRNGSHSAEECQEVTMKVISKLIEKLNKQNIPISNIILKINMVTAGDHSEQISSEEIADRTVDALCLTVPHEIGGVVFLSGGQKPTDAAKNLDSIIDVSTDICTPFPMTFSFGRALQEEAMIAWFGNTKNKKIAQDVMYKIVEQNGLASEGELYN